MRLLVLGLCLWPVAARAQTWNDSAAVALVTRAVARRTAVEGDSGLRSWHVRAHGALVFLAQLGDGAAGTPRLIKADELDVEVYWSAPGRSKQVIRGWRDRRYLPTDIRYHRDHLGIVTDGYGPMIRIGEGDEVRDVVHPLSPAGLALYEYALRDSTQIEAGGERVTLDVIDVRPRDPAGAAVIGTLYLDRASAELVRARFSFTPASYRDATVEDLTILLDYALVDGRAWLPWRQTLEIRRNSGWLDLPYTGVIRATWEFGDYDLDYVIPPTTFAGPAIGGLRVPGDSARPWPEPFDSVLARAGPVASEREVAAARQEVARAVEGRVASGLAPARVSVNSVSDLLHFDRVQGVAVGGGLRLQGRRSRVAFLPRLGIGTADGRVTGGMTIALRPRPGGRAAFDLYAERRIRDLSDLPVMSRALNSLTAQEWGEDHGDYVLVERAGVGVQGGAGCWGARAGYEDPSPLAIAATPARGSFRPQADLGGPGYWAGEVSLGCGGAGTDGWRLQVSGGEGTRSWGRGTVEAQGELRAGATALRASGSAGWASDDTPAWRTFVLGGRGTLIGDRYRGFGGRRMALGTLEWRLPIPVFAIPLGDFASTGHQATLAPFVEAGWADRGVPGLPWGATGGVRSSAGVALELFYGLVRVEAGRSFQARRFGVSFDVTRQWWGVL
ncbi:MAG TPA: hypothetical protein VFI13_07325 [Gemmatimonadales bacterium]|nr:hypothetical protein [Gemmatimonadales bacterium]